MSVDQHLIEFSLVTYRVEESLNVQLGVGNDFPKLFMNVEGRN